MTTRPIAIALLAVLGCVHPRAGGVAGDGSVAVPLRTYAGRLVAVDVELKGVTTPFLVDTSGGLTVLTPESARRVGCAGPPIVALHADGERAELPRCGPVALAIAGQRFESEAAVFDLAKVLPRDAPPVGGVIALGTLEARPFTLELAARRLTLESEASLAARARDALPLRVRVQRAAMGLAVDLFVAVRGVGGPLWFQLDSTNLGDAVVARQALPALAIPEQQGRGLAGGGRGTVDLQVEGLGALPVRAVAGDLIYDGVFSAEAVEMLAITLDLRAGKAWAKRAGPTKSDAADL